MNFQNQTAIVTGAGRGIGHAIAARLASDGARVACVSRREENAKRTADDLNKARADAASALARAEDDWLEASAAYESAMVD